MFSKEQVEWLQKLFSQGSSNIVSTGGIAEKGIFPTGLHVISNPSTIGLWILEPPIICQDLDSRKKIGNARVKDGLYRIEVNNTVPTNKKSFNVGVLANATIKDGDVKMLHYRMGHPNFVYLSKFPTTEPEKELKIYTRRKEGSQARGNETRDEIKDPLHCQEAPLNSHPLEKGNIDPDTDPELNILNGCSNDDLSLPITRRKGVWSCNLHPISHFFSYEKISPRNVVEEAIRTTTFSNKFYKVEKRQPGCHKKYEEFVEEQ
ncbi:Retrovirus-related Pol polyprotein from transposon RE1 [Senna tora]|uniref:Retrovirus-related Pol polyprotein from transposon RE1 n=1 Tax=Senna tora TaxID=362788 RepID=A0A834W723_9FABA|nr:Retrovirus-related Pol polyprotein from transposon RE1 [Senna tora]